MKIHSVCINNLLFKALLISFIVNFTLNIKVNAQRDNIHFERISTEQGLSQVSINCILQDKQGFMWFGSEDGLNKYDGYRIIIYRHDPEDSLSISNNAISSLFEDAEGILWIGTKGGGLNKFDRQTNIFKRYTHDVDKPNSLSSNTVTVVYEDVAGNLWVGTKHGLNKLVNSSNIPLVNDKSGNLNQKIESFIRFNHQEDNQSSISNDAVLSIFEDTGGNLWVGTENGLNVFDRKTNKFIRDFRKSGNSKSLSNNFVSSIYQDSFGNLWIGTKNGLNKLVSNAKQSIDLKAITFINYKNIPNNNLSLSSNDVSVIFQDADGKLWIGTEDGLNLFDYKTNNFTKYKKHNEDINSLGHNSVLSIYEDKGAILWIGTLGGGVNKFDRKMKAFVHYRHRENDSKSLNYNSVRTIYEDAARNIWVGNRHGLNRFDHKTETFNLYQHNQDNSMSLSNNYVRTIFQDSKGSLWLGTNFGLNKLISFTLGQGLYNGKNSAAFYHFLHQDNDKKSLSNNFITSIYEDQTNKLWVGTRKGLNKLVIKKNNEMSLGDTVVSEKYSYTFINYFNEPDNPNSLSNDNINKIYQDKRGNLWIGTNGGGIDKLVIQKEGKTLNNISFIHYQNQKNKHNSLSNNTILCFHEDADGNLWIGTNRGLNKLSPTEAEKKDEKKAIFKTFTEKDGLYNNVVYGILEDDKNNLWISTNMGISKFNIKNSSFTNYDRQDGLQENEFNGSAYFKDRSGRMYFGGINGLNIFYPDNIKPNTYIPPVIITDFLLFNKSVEVSGITSDKFKLKQHINFTKEITLKHTDYIFAFEFSALNYRQSKKNQYKYKLEGLDKDWIETDYKNRRATYTNLPHGEYTFRVIASNDDDYWNEEGASIKITILPPFWKTWWFRSMIIIFVISSLVGFYLLRIKSIKKRNKELEKQVEERTINLSEANMQLEEKQADLETKQEEIISQKEAIEQQNKELEKLSLVAGETENAVIIMDAEGNFEWVNEGFIRMFRCTLQEHIEKNGKNMSEASTNPDIKKIFKECIEHKKSVVYESFTIPESSNKTWLQTTLTPIINSEGNITKFIAIESDVTKIKEAEENIKSSIRYAQTIQNAILPTVNYIREYFDVFILFRPKDIVSGDFYKYINTGEYHFLIVVDCTGHGVPGAFMSIIGNSLLNEIINDKQIYDPAEILTRLNKGVINSLQQKQSENSDGMDVCLCRVKKGSSIELVFSGAKRDLICHKSKSNSIELIKGSRKSIGGMVSFRNENKFENNKINLSKGDVFYLTTDGYIDQNNEERKRIGLKKFIKTLEEIAEKPLKEQKIILENVLDKWQGKEEQRDDITVFGIKL